MRENNVDVLLVEDSPMDAKFVERAFKRMALQPKLHWVKDGAEALEFIFASGVYSDRRPEDLPKVIILDLKLPKVSGKEVLRRIKQNPDTATVPIVVMSSSKEEVDLKETYQLGTNSYIVKSFDLGRYQTDIEQIGTYWLKTNCPPR